MAAKERPAYLAPHWIFDEFKIFKLYAKWIFNNETSR